MEFIVTKEECQKQIDESNKVCSRCGGKLQPIQTVDNAGQPTHWSGCCSHFDSGVTPEIFNAAVYMFDEMHETEYSEQRLSADDIGFDYYRKSNISGLCNKINKILHALRKVTNSEIMYQK